MTREQIEQAWLEYLDNDPSPTFTKVDVVGFVLACVEKALAAHCKDCCCAQSWKALGITGFTGKSIPEHITELRQADRKAREECARIAEDYCHYCTRLCDGKLEDICIACRVARAIRSTIKP